MGGKWLPLDGNWTPAKTHDGPLPGRLFRYRRLDLDDLGKFDFEVLEEGIFLAGAGQLNDKDEGRLHLMMIGPDREVRRHWLKSLATHSPQLSGKERAALAHQYTLEIKNAGGIVKGLVIELFKDVLNDLLRVACFTNHLTSEAMWKEYGVLVRAGKEYGGAGVCIEYEVDEAWRHVGLAPVHYSDSKPPVNVMLPDNELQKQLAEAMFVKSNDWKNEGEWRIIAFLDAKPPYPTNLTTNSKLRFRGSTRSLIFGPDAPADVIDQIRTRIDSKHQAIILLQKVTRHPHSGMLSVSPLL